MLGLLLIAAVVSIDGMLAVTLAWLREVTVWHIYLATLRILWIALTRGLRPARRAFDEWTGDPQ